MRDDRQKFVTDRVKRIAQQGRNSKLKQITANFMVAATKSKYSYNWEWLGVPIIQYPEDIIAMQEIIWTVKPDLIIETGVARGGSVIFYSSLLSLIGKGHVIGIDIDIRAHNRAAIEHHPLGKHITLIEGSSTDLEVVKKVARRAALAKRVLVILDSSHTQEHVLKELQLYSPLVTIGSYIVAFDTVTDFLPNSVQDKNKPWGKNNGPYRAVQLFLKTNRDFVTDNTIDHKLLISVAPGGYLKRISSKKWKRHHSSA